MRALQTILLLLLIPACASTSSKSPDKTSAKRIFDEARQRQAQMLESERLTGEGDKLVLRDPDRAIERYREAIRAWPRAPIAYNNLGFALLQRGDEGDLRDAHDALLIASEQMPTDARPLRNLGVLMMRIGRSSEAYELFAEALDRDPNDLGSLQGIIEAAHATQRADEQTLEYVKRAELFLADTPEWGPYLARQRVRISQELRHDY